MIVHIENHDWDSNWKMDINLENVCKSEGKKVPQINDSGYCTGKMVVDYPMSKVRKLFKLMVDNIQEDKELDEISAYLKQNSKSFCKVFEEIRKKRK